MNVGGVFSVGVKGMKCSFVVNGEIMKPLKSGVLNKVGMKSRLKKFAIARKDWKGGYEPTNCIIKLKSEVHKTHRMTKTRLYRTWINMVSRCSNKNDQSYRLYGGRGIKVCEDWRTSFKRFHKWAIQNGYNAKLTLDRINVDGNYEPSNCRWADWVTQSNNKRNNVYIEYKRKKKSLKNWSRELNISYNILHNRYKKGIRDPKKLFNKVKNKYHRAPILITINEITDSISGWSRRTGISKDTIKKRYDKGVKGTDLIAKVKNKKYDPILIEIDGQKKSLRQWSLSSGIGYSTILYRYHTDVRGKELISPPDKGTKNKKHNKKDN